MDPASYLPSELDRQICVIGCTAITLLIKAGGFTPHSITKKSLDAALELINYRRLLTPRGIPITSFAKLERLNSPPSAQMKHLLPNMSQYQGIAYNVFKAKIVNPDSNSPQAYIFPKLLSLHNSDDTFLQVDLMIDNEVTFYDAPTTNSAMSTQATSNRQTTHHVLAIANLCKLVGRRNPLKRTHASRFSHVCRRCLTLMTSQTQHFRHTSQCRSFPSRRASLPRRTRNVLSYRTLRYNKFTRTHEKLHLRFRAGELHKTLKSLFMSFLDFETIAQKVHSDDRTKAIHPSNTISEQIPFAYSLVHIRRESVID